MRTGRLVALLGAGALLVGALAYGTRPGGDDPQVSAELAGLRASAALEPCPTGLASGLPELSLPCLGGGADVPITGAPGRPQLVNVWATWCEPCRREVPALVELADRAEGRVGVVGVLTTDTQESALTFAQAYGITYPSVVDDDGAVLRQYGSGPPQTLFVRADGSVAFVARGAVTDVEELVELTAQHLGVRL